jgi:hypothetical protein
VIGLGTAMIAVFSVTLLSGQGLVIAIPLGGIFATASSMMMLRHAVA